jgi:hypothetical protein
VSAIFAVAMTVLFRVSGGLGERVTVKNAEPTVIVTVAVSPF